MEKPSAATVSWYESLIPEDGRVKRGQMFGHPCAFVNGNMFFGTFGQSLVVRVGEAAAAGLSGKLPLFEPMPGRPWKEYVQIDTRALPAAEAAALVRVALEATALVPAKVPKPAKGAATKGAAAGPAVGDPGAKKAGGRKAAAKKG